MECPSLDIIDINVDEYPDILHSIKITLRGKRNLFDIYFSVTDIENSFSIVLPSTSDITWINTSSGRDKYLSYPSLKRLLFQIINKKTLAGPYMQWIDSILFGNTKIKPFFKLPYATEQDDIMDGTISDLDDSDSIDSFDGTANVFNIFKQRITELEHKLELKNKDISIMQRDILLRDKEIELLQLKLQNATSSSAEWI